MRLAVVGTGLIGASVGLAARRTGFAEVAGWDEDGATLEVAAERGAVEPAGSLEEALRDADVALVAVPVASLSGVVHDVLDPGTSRGHADRGADQPGADDGELAERHYSRPGSRTR